MKYGLKQNFVKFLPLHALLLLLSFSGVLLKFASQHSIPSFGFLAFYTAALCIMAVYAILWQSVLKKIKLTLAYANTAIVIVYGYTWAFLIFGEVIRTNMVVGAGLIIAGIVVLVSKNAK